MPVATVKGSTKTYLGGTSFCYFTPVNVFLRKINAPGGDLIRVDLIRFPGSSSPTVSKIQ